MTAITIEVPEELVEAVVEEHVSKIMAALAAPSTRASAVLKIGAALDGGTYHGITVYQNTPMRLVTLRGDFVGDWASCVAWAKQQGGTLPSRFDGLVQVINARADFERETYWLADEYAADAGCACSQDFGDGSQNGYHKDSKLRARAVRRLPL